MDAQFSLLGARVSGFWQFPREDRRHFRRQASIRNVRRGEVKRGTARPARHAPRRLGKHPEPHGGRSVLDFEKYYERETDDGYRVIVEPPGKGWRHVLTARDIVTRLDRLPDCLLWRLHSVILPTMTRKRARMRCVGLQWGGTIYLYPQPVGQVAWEYKGRISPFDRHWFGRFGATIRSGANHDKVSWSEEALRCYYLEHVLLHELGHINDIRNNGVTQRERFANYFADFWGVR